jgi:hypothetical protein
MIDDPSKPTCQMVNESMVVKIAIERIQPVFNSNKYGDPGYCQLKVDCAPEIRPGAEDESEMGVFHDLYEPQRESNLRARLADFTPASMQLQILFADEENS